EKLVSGADPDAAAPLGGPWVRGAAALRHGDGGGHLSSRDNAARTRAQALECCLRATLAAAEGRPLRREPEPAAALLPVPGDPQTLAARPAGALSQVALCNRHRSGDPRFAFRR